MALRVEHLEVVFQIGQNAVLFKQGGDFFATHLMFILVLFHTERQEIGYVKFFVFLPRFHFFIILVRNLNKSIFSHHLYKKVSLLQISYIHPRNPF